jgi:colicin import membrane protein
MRPPRYALEPLAKIREERVDEAVRGLAKAVASRESAERGRRAAEAQRTGHEESAARARDAERGALERGELRVEDLARAGEWELRVAAEREALLAAEERARVAAREALAKEQGAMGEVATRKADAEVVEKDRARWAEGQRKRALAREEEEAAEAYRPKR